MGVGKTIREVERMLPEGCTVRVGSTGKHIYLVHGPNGQPLRDENGKVIPVAGTPGDVRHNRNLLGRVRRALRS